MRSRVIFPTNHVGASSNRKTNQNFVQFDVLISLEDVKSDLVDYLVEITNEEQLQYYIY